MKIDYKILKSLLEVEQLLSNIKGPIVLDFETKGTRYFSKDFDIVGLAIGGDICGMDAAYLPLKDYDETCDSLIDLGTKDLFEYLLNYLVVNHVECIFHNFIFDYGILLHLGYRVKMYADTMIMWHMLDNHVRRSYGLKNAQIEILGWSESNDYDLELNVRSKMRKLGFTGDWHEFMHISDLDVISRYASLDAYSTYEVYKKLYPLFTIFNYDWFSTIFLYPYSNLLREQYVRGIQLDVARLHEVYKELDNKISIKHDDVIKFYFKEVKSVERDLKVKMIKKLKTLKAKKRILRNINNKPLFNINSRIQLCDILFRKLNLRPLEFTETGREKLDSNVMERLQKQSEGLTHLLEYNSLLKQQQFVSQYIELADNNGVLHPQFNICGTVSGRLSGYKPNMQQLSKEYIDVLKCFKARKGHKFIYSDFEAAEPTVTAHFADDEDYKKVLLNKWDIYLELVDSIYGPEKSKLYDRTNIPESKKRLEKERKTLKVLHLAAQYGASEYSISKNLFGDQSNYHLHEARKMLTSYWKKFYKVKELGYKLRAIYDHNKLKYSLDNRKNLCYNGLSFIRNGVGRILWLDNTKDITNRFVQSTAHDCLIKLNLIVSRLIKSRGIKMYPLNIDVHDSFLWEVADEDSTAGLEVIKEALIELNNFLGYSIDLKLNPILGDSFEVYNE